MSVATSDTHYWPVVGMNIIPFVPRVVSKFSGATKERRVHLPIHNIMICIIYVI